MAARDAEFYNYLKEALKNKLRYPEAPSFRSGKYFFDYEYIFQQARRVLPQKYSIGHSYWKHDNQRIPISYLNKQQLNELNLEFARDVVENWGGLDQKQADAKYLDPVLAEYENELTAPEEPDSFHEENERNQKPPDQKPDQLEPSQPEQPSAPSVPNIPRLSPPPQYAQRPPAFTRQMEEKLNKANQSMQQTQREISKRFPNAPQPSEKLSERLNSATRTVKGPAPSIPRNRVQAARPVRVNRENRKRRALPPIRPVAGGSGFGIPWAPKFLQRALGNLARGAINGLSRLASSLGRAAMNGIARGIAQILPRVGLQAGLAAGRGLLFGAGAIVTTAAFWWVFAIVAIVGLFIFALWYNNFLNNSQCDKPGQMQVKKILGNPSSGADQVRNGQRIDFVIETTYVWLCTTTNVESITVTDKLPEGVIYDNDNPTAESEIGGVGEGPKGTYNASTRTLTWTVTNIPANAPVDFYFSVTPTEAVNDSWVANSASVSYKVTAAGARSTGTVGGGFPPTQDNCNGKWGLKNPIGNFGDPNCDFEKDKLFALLQQLDPANAEYWFNVVVNKETGGTYDPSIWADPVAVGTPDAEGAWGLFQMGRGKNGQYDHGDVDWQLQTSNAINYNNYITGIGRPWCYWQAAQDRWPAICFRR